MAEQGAALNRGMLTLAREARGMSQLALSKKAEVSQGLISRIENGTLIPSLELLTRLSEALGFPVSFFTEKEHQPHGALSFNRMRRSASVKERHRYRAWCDIHRIHVAQLLKSVTVDYPSYYALPEFEIDLYKESPEILAQRLRAQWGVPSGPIDPDSGVV